MSRETIVLKINYSCHLGHNIGQKILLFQYPLFQRHCSLQMIVHSLSFHCLNTQNQNDMLMMALPIPWHWTDTDLMKWLLLYILM